MAASVTESAQSGLKLSELLDVVWKDYEYVEKSNEPTNSSVIQSRVQEAVEKAEKAVRMVNDLSLFSTNESLDEVATNEIKYLLLPALLGYFVNKSLKEPRIEAVKKAQVYYIDFIRLCKLYGVTDINVPKPYQPAEGKENDKQPQPKMLSGPASLEEQTRKRQMKIERYQSQKELERNLKELFDLVTMETADDESRRTYYITLLKKWINDAAETCESFNEEILLLEHMARMEDNKESQPSQEKNVNDRKKGVFRPFIITKDSIQKQVYGLGYPGVPTVTVDEFYQRRVEEGLFPPAGSVPQGKNDPQREEKERLKAAKKKEEEEERDDDETIRKAREWDDWKDDHRRGWGNTQNKG